MNFSSKLINYIADNCSDYTKKIVNKICNSKYKNEQIHVQAYISEGELLRPINSFKVYINNTLYNFDRSHVLLVYKISSRYQDYNLPSFGNDYTPKVLFIYFKCPNRISIKVIEDHLLSETKQSLLREVIPTTSMNQLLTIMNSCETLGRINMYDE